MKTPYKIRFPLVRERTGYRTGPRYRLVPDRTGLDGARAYAANMIHRAILYRDADRLGMRVFALWARVFAGQIDQHDPRLDASSEARHALITAACTPSTAALNLPPPA